MSCGIGASGTSPEFHGDHPELRSFWQQLESKLMGSYTPGEGPTVFNPLDTLNPFARATLFHECTHEELILTTIFGGFFTFLMTLGRFGHFKHESLICFNHQWEVQEACATYAGMAIVANYGTEAFENALCRLPSNTGSQPPYREVFDLVSNYLPLVPSSGRPKLESQVATIVGLGHCALNGNYYEIFKNSNALTEATLKDYFKENSPNRRFRQVLATLGAKTIKALAGEVEANRNSANFNPVRHVLQKVSALMPELPIIAELDQIRSQHAAFCESWRNKFCELTGEPLIIGSGGRKHAIIPQSAHDVTTTRISLDDLGALLRKCKETSQGLWVIIYMEDKSVMKLDAFPFAVDFGSDPVLEITVLREFLKYGFFSGVFPSNEIIALFRQFSGLPTAITFIKWSWHFWMEAGGGELDLKNCVQVNLDRTLRKESVVLHLRFQQLGIAAEYSLISYDEMQAVACLADPKRPGIYALQYLAGEVGCSVFRDIASALNLHGELAPAKYPIVHLPLLRLMAFPAFVMADPDARGLLMPILKLLGSA